MSDALDLNRSARAYGGNRSKFTLDVLLRDLYCNCCTPVRRNNGWVDRHNLYVYQDPAPWHSQFGL